MELAFTKDEDQFRDEVRTWLSENSPCDRRPRDVVGMRAFDCAWQRKQSMLGGPGFPGRWNLVAAGCR